ncbi:RCC1 and BTB domain-containing protein 2-like [Oppia nitens]|uniref:RCC1 and BTB domain-containing protein 2-like n=1 Tax=Oppia nitens TaxID=1686743 RepID=UPI0023DA8C6F|nr:RCC1 and BTB domain-containing protein 2-like [Oppia nitens]
MDSLREISTFVALKPLVNDKRRQFRYRLKLLSLFGSNGSSVIFITDDDQVYGYGNNRFGCLGVDSVDEEIPEPRPNSSLSGKHMATICSGFAHCIGITASGLCYSWGDNNYEQLGWGIDHTVMLMSATPRIVPKLADKQVIRLACGNRHTLVLTQDGYVYAWGHNTYGQIGNYAYLPASEPAVIVQPRYLDIVDVVCGKGHSLALTSDGHVYVWGLNEWGQLGRDPSNDVHNCRQKCCSNRPKPLASKLLTGVSIKKAQCGPTHTLLLSTDGDLYSFGNNDTGQVGNGFFEPQYTPVKINTDGVKFKDIVAYFDNNVTIGISTNNRYYVWGFRRFPRPQSIPEHHNHYTVYDVYSKYSRVNRTFKAIHFRNGKVMDLDYNVVGGGDATAADNNNNNNDKYEDNDSNCFATNKLMVKKQGVVSSVVGNDDDTSGSVGVVVDNIHPKYSYAHILLQKSGTNVASLDQIGNNLFDNIDDDNGNDLLTPSLSPEQLSSRPSSSADSNASTEPSKLLLQQYLSQAFNNPTTYDLTFIINGRPLYCHKTILRIRNKHFYRNCCKYLRTTYCEKTRKEIVINSYSYDVFHDFLRFLYGLSLPTITVTTVHELYKLAVTYEEQDLLDLCLEFIDVDNVCTVYKRSIECRLKPLETTCLEFMSANWKQLCRSAQFLALDDAIGRQILSQVLK